MNERPATALGLVGRMGCIGLFALIASDPAAVRAEPLEVESAYTLIGQTCDDAE